MHLYFFDERKRLYTINLWCYKFREFIYQNYILLYWKNNIVTHYIKWKKQLYAKRLYTCTEKEVLNVQNIFFVKILHFCIVYFVTFTACFRSPIQAYSCRIDPHAIQSNYGIFPSENYMDSISGWLENDKRILKWYTIPLLHVI